MPRWIRTGAAYHIVIDYNYFGSYKRSIELGRMP